MTGFDNPYSRIRQLEAELHDAEQAAEVEANERRRAHEEIEALKAAIQKVLPGAMLLKIENPTVGGFEYSIGHSNMGVVFAAMSTRKEGEAS